MAKAAASSRAGGTAAAFVDATKDSIAAALVSDFAGFSGKLRRCASADYYHLNARHPRQSNAPLLKQKADSPKDVKVNESAAKKSDVNASMQQAMVCVLIALVLWCSSLSGC